MTPLNHRDQLLEDIANGVEHRERGGWLKPGTDYWELGYWTLAFMLAIATVWTGSKLVAVLTLYAVTAPTVLRLSGLRRWLEGD